MCLLGSVRGTDDFTLHWQNHTQTDSHNPILICESGLDKVSYAAELVTDKIFEL
jgi:hypothetical protein